MRVSSLAVRFSLPSPFTLILTGFLPTPKLLRTFRASTATHTAAHPTLATRPFIFKQLVSQSPRMMQCCIQNKLLCNVFLRSTGSFGDGAGITEQYVEWLREYCESFYNGLTVKLLPAVTVAASSCTFRVNSNTNNLQLHAGEYYYIQYSKFIVVAWKVLEEFGPVNPSALQRQTVFR